MEKIIITCSSKYSGSGKDTVAKMIYDLVKSYNKKNKIKIISFSTPAIIEYMKKNNEYSNFVFYKNNSLDRLKLLEFSKRQKEKDINKYVKKTLLTINKYINDHLIIIPDNRYKYEYDYLIEQMNNTIFIHFEIISNFLNNYHMIDRENYKIIDNYENYFISKNNSNHFIYNKIYNLSDLNNLKNEIKNKLFESLIQCTFGDFL